MYDEQFKDGKSSEAARALVDRIPMGRLARPEDISSTILFLLSDEASYTTGQILTVSGGS
jgi:3-oxoacyl-[acyl-carrier protein] reductase